MSQPTPPGATGTAHPLPQPFDPGIEGANLRGGTLVDRIYDGAITFFALCVPLLLLLLIFEVGKAGWPAFQKFGFGFLFSSDWDAVNLKFGAAPAIFGTIVSSIIALILATPLALGVAIYVAEFAPPGGGTVRQQARQIGLLLRSADSRSVRVRRSAASSPESHTRAYGLSQQS